MASHEVCFNGVTLLREHNVINIPRGASFALDFTVSGVADSLSVVSCHFCIAICMSGSVCVCVVRRGTTHHHIISFTIFYLQIWILNLRNRNQSTCESTIHMNGQNVFWLATFAGGICFFSQFVRLHLHANHGNNQNSLNLELKRRPMNVRHRHLCFLCAAQETRNDLFLAITLPHFSPVA